MPEVFALVREAGVRALGMRHFDVQLIGGVVLHSGKIAEMKTGEGKTLVATLPCVLNALGGRGVHVVTVNDYLARRDAEWMGRLYRYCGLSTGVIVHGLTDQERQTAYHSDITYGQNNEFGFDYLRDNMKFRLQDYVQGKLGFAIVDEVDSILWTRPARRSSSRAPPTSRAWTICRGATEWIGAVGLAGNRGISASRRRAAAPRGAARPCCCPWCCPWWCGCPWCCRP